MRYRTIALVVILLVGPVPARAEGPRRVPGEARWMPLGQLLGELNPQTSRDPDIEEALRRALQGKNYILIYWTTRLGEVRVFGEGETSIRYLAVAPAPALKGPRPVRQSGEPGRPTVDGPGRLRSEALGNPDPAERASALDRLAASSDRALALWTALDVLEREREPEVLESALNLLSAQESVPVEPLLRIAVAGRDPTQRVQALELAAEQGKADPRVRGLLKTLSTDQAEEVREAAQRLLEDLDAD